MSADERPIVVGYNGRKHSTEALQWAAAEAVRREAPLLVVYAANYPGMALGAGAGIAASEHLLTPDPGALDAAEEVTTLGVTQALQAHRGLRAGGATEVTSPVQALVEASADARLLVIGTRGHGRILGALLGSVAFAVAAGAECPVVVVKGEPEERPVGPGHRVVVGADGSDDAAAAVDFAARRAADDSAALEILSCTGEHPDSVDAEQLRAAAEEVARSAAAAVAEAHPELTVTTRVEDSPAERTLVDATADAGLVVLGTRGRGAFKGMVLGSVSHAVIHGAQCPVAIVDSPAG